MDEGAEYGIAAGRGWRAQMLRLEAGMVMGEFEYDLETSPWEASLGWVVDLNKKEFHGREAVLELRDERPGRLVSVVLESVARTPRPARSSRRWRDDRRM